MKVLAELRHRKVLQTAALYFAGAWGVTEILSYLIEHIPVFPAWTETAIAVLFVLGFPVTVFLSWMFDIREGGVRRADPASGMGKGVIALSLAGLLALTAGLSYLIWPRVLAQQGIVAAGDLGTVAVLPFENLTGDPSLGYLGAGLAEDIRQRLQAQTDLKVIGRVSMAGFAGGGADLASLRNLLDAGHVLEGNLQQVAGTMQVGVALLDTASGKQLWGNTFTADKAGWDPLRQRIVASLAEQLALTVRVRKAEAPVPTEALEAYLHGLAELNQPEVADSWFDEAVRQAPDFADAWARKALLRVDMVWRDQPVAQAWDEAQPMFARARQTDPDNLLADIAEASLLWVAKIDPLASYEVLKRAQKRAPNDPLVLAGLSTAYGFVPGHLQDSVAYGRRYLALDPLNPDAHNRLGLALMFNGKLDEALEENQRAIDLDPHFSRAWDYRANWQFFKNRPVDALVTLTRRAQLENPASNTTVRCMIFVAGAILPNERALPLLQDAVDRGVGMTNANWWCANPLQTLIGRLDEAGDRQAAEAARKRLAAWYAQTGATRDDTENLLGDEPYTGPCANKLCRIREVIGDEGLAKWLGPDPPLQYFNFGQAVEIAEALIEAGRVEDARNLAAISAPVAREYAGPAGSPTTSWKVLRLYILSGDTETALNYAEQIGPDGFFKFGTQLGDDAPELEGNPRWAAFLEQGRARLQAEVKKYDRLLASGDIVMP